MATSVTFIDGLQGHARRTYHRPMVDPDDAAMAERAALASKAAINRVRERIAQRIKETGIPVSRLARRAGVSPRTIQRLLAEPDRDFYVGTVAALANVLLIDVHELFIPVEPPDRA